MANWLISAGTVALYLLGATLVILLLLDLLVGIRYIPHSRVGVVEKLWSWTGALREGEIIATGGEAGLQAHLLRGGLHLGLPMWQYRLHKSPLVTVPEGSIGYVYARDGVPLPATQALGRMVACNSWL